MLCYSLNWPWQHGHLNRRFDNPIIGQLRIVGRERGTCRLRAVGYSIERKPSRNLGTLKSILACSEGDVADKPGNHTASIFFAGNCVLQPLSKCNQFLHYETVAATMLRSYNWSEWQRRYPSPLFASAKTILQRYASCCGVRWTLTQRFSTCLSASFSVILDASHLETLCGW